MTKTGILFVGFLFASTSVFAIGCGDDTEGDTSSSSSSSSTSSSSGESSSSSSSSTSSSGSMAAVDKYCTDVMANCTGTNAQYPSPASCKAAAAALPPGMDTDTKGNTLGCRQYHVGAAGNVPANQDLHCVHAGPAGGGAAFCGDTCEGFCDIATVTCKGEWPVKADCLTACKTFQTAVMNYNTSITSGDTVECRLYHLSVAATDAASAATHCPHTMAVSSQCK